MILPWLLLDKALVIVGVHCISTEDVTFSLIYKDIIKCLDQYFYIRIRAGDFVFRKIKSEAQLPYVCRILKRTPLYCTHNGVMWN